MRNSVVHTGKLRSELPWLVLIAICCVLLMIAFPLAGTPIGYDLAQHFRFAAEYNAAIADGKLMPLWADVDNLGFGSIGVRFYPPLADLALGLTQFFTGDWFTTTWINSFFWMFPGAFGVYFWVRQFRDAVYAAFAAILYSAMPYHVLQIYQLQLYSEFVAAAILPFCFLFSTRLARRGRMSDLVGLAVSSSLLLHTHLPASMIGFAGLAIYTALIIEWRSPFGLLWKYAIAGSLTIASAAYYLVRLITEINWVKHSSAEFSSGFFDHRTHFFPLFNNFGDNYWGLNLWLLDATVVFVGSLLIPLILGCFVWRRSTLIEKFERKLLVAVSVTGVFGLFMLSGLSAPVWKTVTVFQKIQFPWRFLSLVSLMAAVSFSLALPVFAATYKRASRVFIYGAITLMIGVAMFDLTQVIGMAGLAPRDKYYESVVSKRSEESCKCWWPTWAEKAAFDNAEKVSAYDREVNITAWNKISRSFNVSAGNPTEVRVATFYYPYWKATVNGKAVELSKDENGALLVPVPADAASVNIYFEEPGFYRVAAYLSIMAFGAFLVMICVAAFQTGRSFDRDK